MTRKKNKTPDIQGELIGQLGYPKHLPIVLPNTGNSRNEHGMSVRDMQAMLLENSTSSKSPKCSSAA